MPPRHPPGTLDVRQALAASPPLSGLLQQWERARKCMQEAYPVLGADLAATARTGPIRDGCWTLLADHAPAAAKIRQLMPELLRSARRVDPGLQEVRVKVAPR